MADPGAFPDEIAAPNTVPDRQMLTSFAGSPANGRVVRCHANDATVVAMATGEQLCVVGAAELSVAGGGDVEVLGYLVQPDTPRLLLVSPPWEAALCLVALPHTTPCVEAKDKDASVSGTGSSAGDAGGTVVGGGGVGGGGASAPWTVTGGSSPVEGVVATMRTAHPGCVVLVLWDLHEPATWLEGYAFVGGGAVEEQLCGDLDVPGLRLLCVWSAMPCDEGGGVVFLICVCAYCAYTCAHISMCAHMCAAFITDGEGWGWG